MKQVTKLGVMGNPIGHSLSPEIHLMFAKQFGDEISYDKVEIPLGEFDRAIGEMIVAGYPLLYKVFLSGSSVTRCEYAHFPKQQDPWRKHRRYRFHP